MTEMMLVTAVTTAPTITTLIKLTLTTMEKEMRVQWILMEMVGGL